MSYMGTVGRVKQYPIGSRKLKTVTPEHLQALFDHLSFGGVSAGDIDHHHALRGLFRIPPDRHAV